MSADEIKALAQQAFVDVMASHRAGLHDVEVRCRQYSAALLSYADMVERCEKEIEATSCKDCGKYNGCPCADHDDCGLYKWHNRFVKILCGGGRG